MAMGSEKKKRPFNSAEESDAGYESKAASLVSDAGDQRSGAGKPMEKLKKRRELDKERHHRTEPMETVTAVRKGSGDSVPPSGLPELHVDVFRDLAAADRPVREAAAEKLVLELREVQLAYEKMGTEELVEGDPKLEDEKDDGLDCCAPALRYAVRRLIRGVSSSRECARQGFSVGLAAVLQIIPVVKVDSLLKLIVDLLEVSSSMKGQDVRDCLLGRLFAYGSLARSGRIASEWISYNSASSVKDFTTHIILLAGKKRYLREPAVAVILDFVEQLPVEALKGQVLEVPEMNVWFQKAAEDGDVDALFLALKLQKRVPENVFGGLLPYPFSSDNFFARNNLPHLASCFQESTFCLPRVHSLWPLIVNMLIPEGISFDGDACAGSASSKKHKKRRKASSHEETSKNLRNFCEIVIEELLLLSSHDRKHLALDVLLLILPMLPGSCADIIISHKLVQCLMDILATKKSLLYNAAQHFVKELSKWVEKDDDRRATVILSLQKHSGGRFDSITRTQTVKGLVAMFNTVSGCLLFIHKLTSLFVDDKGLTDEPSDQSQTTDENSEMGSADDDSPGAAGTMDILRSWIIDTMPRILKNLKPKPNVKAEEQDVNFMEERFRVQTEILKFLAVQGLFYASLGTEVTSFELQEKFKWPKAPTSILLCKMCIEQLQSLIEVAQKEDASHLMSDDKHSDLGSYFMCFLKTLCNIPSVSLYRQLSIDDEQAFKKLQDIESRLSQEEMNSGSRLNANKLHAIRYLLIQLLLQVLLQPQDFFDPAMEFVICCNKAFPDAAHGFSSAEEHEGDADNASPELMDVLVDTFLQLLPQSSGPLCFAIKKVFNYFCDGVTSGGLLRMFRILKEGLKPARRQVVGSDDGDEDDDEDFLGFEDEESDEAESAETGDGEEGEAEGISKSNTEVHVQDVTIEGDEVERHYDYSDATVTDEAADSEDYDDDTMFRLVDPAITAMLSERKISGNDSLSQLTSFKLSVLSLLEIYLQKNPGSSHVLMIYSCLMQAFVNSCPGGASDNLSDRIQAILHKRILKANDYPKGNDIKASSLEILFEKSLKLACRNRLKMVSSTAQASIFWILKVIHSRNFSEAELERVFDILQSALMDYLNNKKCRLKSGFLKETFRRHPWLGQPCFGFLLEKCRSSKLEFRKIEVLDLLDCTIKLWTPKGKQKKGDPNNSKMLKQHLPALCDLIHDLLSRLPEKQSRRSEVRRFCGRTFRLISALNLSKAFLKALKPEGYSLCESQLGDVFLPIKTRKTEKSS